MMRKIFLSAFLSATMLGVTPMWAAQSKDVPASYDPAAEKVISGTVSEVISSMNTEGDAGVHLLLKTDAGVVTVHLGPAMFIGMSNFCFLVEDQVALTAVPISKDGKTLLARTITVRGTTLVLRDETGMPVWEPKIEGTDGCGIAHPALSRGTTF